MLYRSLIGAVVLTAMPTGEARAWDDAKYPNWKGQWRFLSADGFLMPAKKDQAPPGLRYFNQSRK